MFISTPSSARMSHLSTIVASPNTLFRQRIVQELAGRNCAAAEAGGGAEAMALIEEGACRTLLLDQCLADLNPEELMAMIHARHPEVEIKVLDSRSETGVSGDLDLCSDSTELYHLLQNSRAPRIPRELPDPLGCSVAPCPPLSRGKLCPA